MPIILQKVNTCGNTYPEKVWIDWKVYESAKWEINENKSEKCVRLKRGKIWKACTSKCGKAKCKMRVVYSLSSRYACTSVYIMPLSSRCSVYCIMRRYIIHTPPITQCMYVEHPHHLLTCGAHAYWLRVGVSFLTGSCQDTVLLFNIILTLFYLHVSRVNSDPGKLENRDLFLSFFQF